MYSPRLLDHFEHPRNAGDIAAPGAAATIENPSCGDVMTLQLRIAKERIAEAKFRAKGCVAAIACGSALTELLAGQPLATARSLTREQIVDTVGGLPPASEHASHLAWDVLQEALKLLR